MLCCRQWTLGRRNLPGTLRAFTSRYWRSALKYTYNLKPTTQFRLSAESKSSYDLNRNLAETTNLASFGAVTETETEIRSVSTVRCNWKSVFQDGGRQTGSTHISVSRQDSNSVPTASPTFSASSNSMALSRIRPDITGSRNSKMAKLNVFQRKLRYKYSG